MMIYSAYLHSPRQREREYLAGWQRARADLDNFRRRLTEQGQADSERNRREALALLLPLADNFQAIIAHQPPELKDNPWAAGVIHVARQLEQLLAEQGVTPINNMAEPFDPARHEAVKTVRRAQAQTGQIVEIVQIGYVYRDEVLRPAKVKVAA